MSTIIAIPRGSDMSLPGQYARMLYTQSDMITDIARKLRILASEVMLGERTPQDAETEHARILTHLPTTPAS